MMRKSHLVLLATVLLLAATTGAWSRSRSLPEPLGQLDRNQMIEQHFRARALDPVEGIWASDDNQYELAILQNKPGEYKTGEYQGYDYIGVIIDTNNRDYKRGELKCLLKRTASTGLYPGTWFVSNKEARGTTFILSDGNTIKYTINFGLLQGREPMMLIRVYPEVSSAPGPPPVAAPSQRSATGFFIASDLVATNYHVVADCKDIRLILSDGTEVAGIAAVCDPANDVALIRANRHVDQVTALSVGDPLSVRGGGRVYTIGFPMPDDLGVNAKVSEGIINSITGMDDDPRMYQISIPIQPGNSGGPLLDSKGCVIGVVTSTLNNVYAFRRAGTIPQNVNFAIKINYLDNLIAVLPGGAQVSRRAPDKELDVTEITTSVRPAIVLIMAKG